MHDYVDVPLNEALELYDICVMSGGAIMRSWQTNSPSQLYTNDQQIADFGSVQGSYTVKIDQRSAAIGPGAAYNAILTVQ